MIKKYSIIIVTFLTFFMAGGMVGCASYYYVAKLSNVEKNAKAKEKSSQHKIEGTLLLPEPKNAKKEKSSAHYEDNIISIKFFPAFYDQGIFRHVNGISFLLINKTEDNMKILWDNAMFIFPNGNTSRVHHTMQFAYKVLHENQLPSLVARKSSISDIIYPIEKLHVWTDEKNQMFWHNNDLFKISNYDFKNSYQGKDFKLVLPLQIENDVYEYTFLFQFTDVKEY